MATPYQRSAKLYVEAGWMPVPTTAGSPDSPKGVPLAGWTGSDGALVDGDQWLDLALGAGANTHPFVSLRAYGWVGIDVDEGYGDKCGAAQLAEIEEIFGALPPTYYSTARGAGPSGIRYYRIPAGLTVMPEGKNFDLYGTSIEVIRFEHRYAKAWPTIHPNGNPYRWYKQQDGPGDQPDFELPEGQVPLLHNVPELPEAWLVFLTTDNREPTRIKLQRDSSLRGSEDRLFADLDEVEHFNAQARQACLDRPEGSGFNQALNDYAYSLSRFIPEFYTEDDAAELCYEVVRHHWPSPNAADRATIRSGLLKSRPNFYARRPTEEERRLGQTGRSLDWSADLEVEPLPRARTYAPRQLADWLQPFDASSPAVVSSGNNSDRYLSGRVCDATGRVPGEPLDALFSDPAFPMFGHLRQFARARGVSPAAALGVLLTRITAAIPPYVVTPDIVGGYGSLNAFCCLVGQAGMSKGGATAAAADAVLITMPHTADGIPVQVFDSSGNAEALIGPPFAVKIGSGQGVAAAFAHRRKPDPKTGDPGQVVRDRDSVLFTCSEVADLTAKSSGASTLLPTICEMWVAEPLGSSYVDPTKRIPVDGMSYRACFLLHGQPDLMAPLLIDAAPNGVPQRFLFLPVRDEYRPDNRPERPEPLEWRAPSVPRLAGGRAVVPVCATARDEIIDHGNRMHAGLADPLDGHALFARLKTAVAINACRGKIEVDDAAWTHAGELHALSKRTRTEVIDYLRSQKRAGYRQAAEAEGHKEVVKAEIVHAQTVDKARARILEVLSAAPEFTLTKRDIQKRCSRKWDGEAFDDVCKTGAVVWKEVPTAAGGTQEKTVYALGGS